MWIVVAIIVLLIILLLAAIMSSITITLWYSKHNKDDKAVLDVKMLYGFVKMHYEMPSLVFANMKKGFSLRLEKKNNIRNRETAGKTYLNKRRVDRWADEVRVMLKSTASLKGWFNRTMQHVQIMKLDWSTNVSTGDAAWTAIATGTLWGIKTTLVGWLSYKVRMRNKPKLFVVPVFNDEPQFATELSCVARISCGYALYAGVVLMVRILKVPGGPIRWLRLAKQAMR
ncbi:DUF2953 domain-containing protein [Paenibacillus sp. XY044]|uniref:DUF2953 domain-containing protein n=1 Tax=Paenibacillus sp. XY044 TaxID=2026089 RepID=UPI0015C695FA|nr:DUF2953 domain-containing protein [Paenibacillus sp. XY044]